MKNIYLNGMIDCVAPNGAKLKFVDIFTTKVLLLRSNKKTNYD